mgnify:CR=1 FL=1|nr:MAG TPA: hypothetical protein [Caudoviricetes sp.]
MNNLKLVETDVFNEIATCDFWGDANNEYLVTREQIGRALGYSNPTKAIDNIHRKHKERLDKFSTTLTLGVVEGDRYVERERILYNRKGIMEICRWSRQPLADKFMDWCWEVMDRLISNSTNVVTMSREEYSTIANITKEIVQFAEQVKSLSELSKQVQVLSAQNAIIQDKLSRVWQKITLIAPPVNHSPWKNEMAQKISSIATLLGYTNNDDRKSIYADIYSIMYNDYGVDLNKQKEEYLLHHTDCKNISAIDIVDKDITLREIFDEVVDNYIQIKSGMEVAANA